MINIDYYFSPFYKVIILKYIFMTCILYTTTTKCKIILLPYLFYVSLLSATRKPNVSHPI